MTAREIAEDFISKMNPSRWAGVGQKPDNFDLELKHTPLMVFMNMSLIFHMTKMSLVTLLCLK